MTRPVLPCVTCLKCGTVYFVTSERRLRLVGHDNAGVDRYRRCRCGSSNFRRAKDGDAPELVTLRAILTDVIDPAVVAAWEKLRDEA